MQILEFHKIYLIVECMFLEKQMKWMVLVTFKQWTSSVHVCLVYHSCCVKLYTSVAKEDKTQLLLNDNWSFETYWFKGSDSVIAFKTSRNPVYSSLSSVFIYLYVKHVKFGIVPVKNTKIRMFFCFYTADFSNRRGRFGNGRPLKNTWSCH